MFSHLAAAGQPILTTVGRDSSVLVTAELLPHDQFL